MGVVDPSIWRQQNEALRRKLKNCQTDICTCLQEYMDQQMNGGDGMKSTWDNMTNQYAEQSGMPGHWEKFQNSRSGYQNAADLWDDNGCGGGAPAHAEWPAMRERTLGDAYGEYENNWGQAMPAGGPSALGRVGWAALGVVGVVGTGVLLLSPFEGPFGEAAAGAATVSAFGMAFQ